MRVYPLYETDFYAWTQQQIGLLKECRWEQLDVANLIEEIASLGRKERQELRNRLGVLLGHLLKWQFQPEGRSNSRLATIREQRREIGELLRDNPSLQPYLGEAWLTVYEGGLDLAVRETNFSYGAFPTVCPFTLEQSLNPDFLPGKETT
ncbi:DUF29 domain-containing protein [Gloeobacter violaceus]|uniref:Gll1998 protein n=1 Tax=Gloeobacter violaceus (strain ATCC 29082 / PCC 7421) TaxID=251221 RepID=Q7NJ34_GLOVI|nr:DUF29 domain-containing protein [Gloeobacter violaceus]BAC89939.1 gll1998 [Gloeobacter violaceus PCC 7421]